MTDSLIILLLQIYIIGIPFAIGFFIYLGYTANEDITLSDIFISLFFIIIWPIIIPFTMMPIVLGAMAFVVIIIDKSSKVTIIGKKSKKSPQ